MPSELTNAFWHTHNASHTVFVFIHGIFSNSHSCWQFEGDATHVGVYWPDLIGTDPRLNRPSIFMAGYHTAIDAGDFPLSQCAREVFDDLGRKSVQGGHRVLDFERIVFICHSTGGIVARYMLERYREPFADKAIGLALMASPSLGSGWADLASAVARYSNQRLGLQLRWNNSELGDLHGRFRDLFSNKEALMPGLFGMEAAEHHMVFRTRIPKLIRWLLPPKHRVVSTLSAGQYFGAVKILPGTDHFSIVKPNSIYHPGHEFIVDFMPPFEAVALRILKMPTETQALAAQENEAAVNTTEIQSPMPRTSMAFIAAAGFEHDGDVGVVAYVVVEDVAALARRFQESISALSEDRYFQGLPGVDAQLRRRRVSYNDVDIELRVRLSEALARLIFEAYVCYRRPRQSGAGPTLYALSGSLLFPRLRSNAYEYTSLVLAPSSADRAESLRSTAGRVVKRIKEIDRRDVHTDLIIGQPNDAGCIVAEYVANIVARRLTDPKSKEARAFDRIHPTKLRLIQDFDTGQFYTRKNVFPN